VIIFGTYAYGQTAPWKKLPEDKNATTLSSTELEDLVTNNLETIQARATERAAIIASLAQ